MTTTLRPLRGLLIAVIALVAVDVLADWYSVAHHLPYAVGGHGRPDQVGQDWPSHGTALGPPLTPFIGLTLGAALAVARRWWGGIGDVLLLLVGAAELFGTLAEPSFRHVFTPSGFDAVQLLFRLATLAAVCAVAGTAVLDLRTRVRQRVGVPVTP